MSGTQTGFVVFLLSRFLFADPTPFFGYSGVYPGTISYRGQNIGARFEIVQFQDSSIRGFINTDTLPSGSVPSVKI